MPKFDRPATTYAHFCRDGHVQIGHNESRDNELCPMCHAVSALEAIKDLSGRNGPPNDLDALNEIERRANTALTKLSH